MFNYASHSFKSRPVREALCVIQTNLRIRHDLTIYCLCVLVHTNVLLLNWYLVRASVVHLAKTNRPTRRGRMENASENFSHVVICITAWPIKLAS